MFSPYFHPVCTNCLHCLLCGLTNIGYVLFWFFGFIAVLACAISCLCVTRMANIINVPILECIAGCWFSSLHYPSGGDCNHPGLPCLFWLPFFGDAKRGKIGMTMIILIRLGLSWLFTILSLLWLDLVWHSLIYVFYVNMVIWFVIIKKGEFVELMQWEVLMITNTNEISPNATYTWVCCPWW